MTEKKTFYSLMKENHIIGAEKKEGIRIFQQGIEVYAYENDRGMVHIIEPGSGFSVNSDFCMLEDAEILLLTPEIIKKIKIMQEWPEYPLRVEVFNQLKIAAQKWETYSKKIDEIVEERNKKEVSKTEKSEITQG